METMRTYVRAIRALWRGLRLTLRHALHPRRAPALVGVAPKPKPKLKPGPEPLPVQGLVTMRYPKEKLPIPDHGRNILHNEMEDCILCDKCARICPVDCIDIQSIRSPEVIGHTSDGTPKRLHGARFDIDMARCFFCGLCTMVCPTESLTMQPTYDYTTEDTRTHTLSFATLSEEEIAAHQARWDAHLAEKQEKQKETHTHT